MPASLAEDVTGCVPLPVTGVAGGSGSSGSSSGTGAAGTARESAKTSPMVCSTVCWGTPGAVGACCRSTRTPLATTVTWLFELVTSGATA